MNPSSFIKKEDTNVIKGVALIFMFIHHFFTFPEWLPEEMSTSFMGRIGGYFNEPFAICVPIFAFLTGYFYCFTKDQTWRYSLKKSTDLWVHYIFTFGILVLGAAFMGCYEWSAGKFVLESVGLYLPTMKFCWYVSFYYMSIFILPVFVKCFAKSPILSTLIAVVLPGVFVKVLDPLTGSVAVGILYDLSTYLTRFACVVSGYVFAKYELFEQMKKSLLGKNKAVYVLLQILFMLTAFLGGGLGKEMGAVIAPLFVFGLVNIIHMVKKSNAMLPLRIIGKYSLSMWFLHSVFFNQCEVYTKKLLYWPQCPLLILLWGLALCMAVAVVIEIPIHILTVQKNRLLSFVIGKKS